VNGDNTDAGVKVRKKSVKPRLKNTNGEEKPKKKTPSSKTPVETISSEPTRQNFSFSDNKEINTATDMLLKNNLV